MSPQVDSLYERQRRSEARVGAGQGMDRPERRDGAERHQAEVSVFFNKKSAAEQHKALELSRDFYGSGLVGSRGRERSHDLRLAQGEEPSTSRHQTHVVRTLPTSTTNMTGFLAMTRGWS